MILIDCDMPKCCGECPCLGKEHGYCNAYENGKRSVTYSWYGERPRWCPIVQEVEQTRYETK